MQARIQAQVDLARKLNGLLLKPDPTGEALVGLEQLLNQKDVSKKATQYMFDTIIKIAILVHTNDQTSLPDAAAVLSQCLTISIKYPDAFTSKQLNILKAFAEQNFSFIANRLSQLAEQKAAAQQRVREAPDRLRIAETVLKSRTSRIALVLERTYDGRNQQAVMRTAEALGIQYFYLIRGAEMKREDLILSKKITKGNDSFLTIKEFDSTTACIEHLRAEGRQIWATDLSPAAVPLEVGSGIPQPLPRKIAVVFGREADGCSQEILAAADRRVYLPLFGFTESLNLSVAAALVMQFLFSVCPEARGDLSEEEKAAIRRDWYEKLAKSDSKRDEYLRWLPNPPEPLSDLRKADKEKFVSSSILNRIGYVNGEQEPSSGDASAGSSIEPPQAKRAKTGE